MAMLTKSPTIKILTGFIVLRKKSDYKVLFLTYHYYKYLCLTEEVLTLIPDTFEIGKIIYYKD